MEIGHVINRLADAIGANRGIATILDNPIYFALVITLMIMLIYYISGGANSVRTAFYIFVAMTAFLFIYHRRFNQRKTQTDSSDHLRDALQRSRDVAGTSIDSVPIKFETPESLRASTL